MSLSTIGHIFRKSVLASVILFGLISGAFAKESRENPETLTWMECVKEASLNSPGIQAVQKTIESKNAARKGAYSTFLPQILATSSITRSHNERNNTTDATVVSDTGQTQFAATSFGSPTAHSYYSDSYSIGLSLDQQLFDGFQTKGNIDQARSLMHVAIAQLLTEKALVSFELKSAFAQLLYAQELIGISHSIASQRELNYRLVELKYEIGRENKGSLLLSKANLSQAQLNINQAERTLRVSQRQLLSTMGRTTFRPVVAQGKLVTYNPIPDPDFQALAIKTPAHFQQSATVDASKAGITIAQSDFYPQISASASVSGQSSSSFEMPRSWQVGINGSWAIFDGSATYFNVRTARAALQSEQAALRSTDSDTAQLLAGDYKDYLNAIENVRISQEFLEASALRAKIAEAQYRNGLISFQDFDTITNDYISRQQTELQTRRDAVLAEAKWEESQGIGAIP